MASPDTLAWPVKDIVYVSIVGVLMLAAAFEWVLWLLAFLYCLVKAYQKAETAGTKILAVIMMVLFSLLRLAFLPIMVVTLPLPPQIVSKIPGKMTSALQWFAFWSFSGLLTIPWLLCVYQLITHSLGRTKRIKWILNEISAPKVVIVMPCYNEEPEVLLRTIESIVQCDYPATCLHIFLSFDGDRENDLYLNTIEKLGVPLIKQSGYPTSIDIPYKQTRVTVSRFPHGGKRHCQKKSFQLIDKIYSKYLEENDNLFVLFIDSDCILDQVCIQNFMYEMELAPDSSQDVLAMTGVITSTTEKHTLLTLLQDLEYLHGQLYERSVESALGSVTCLPGALTILRFSAFRKLAKEYFTDKSAQMADLFDYGKCHLGEDRWLTHLFMIAAQKPYQIKMSTGAFCKTEAVQSLKSLMKQRRRWFLGFITNEVCMLTDIRLWKRYPFLCLMRLAQNTIRTTALLFFIMLIALMSTSQTIDQLPVGFMAVSLGLNWALMIYLSTVLRRWKILLYPLLFLIGPFLNWLYMVYGIFTATQRTWGGPRADASHATAEMSPQAAIEEAEARGDDLNIVPETFRPALEEHVLGYGSELSPVQLQPSERFRGRFRANTVSYDSFYSPSHMSHEVLSRSRGDEMDMPVPRRRRSLESSLSLVSDNASICLPRRVESIFGGDDDRLQIPHQRPRISSHPPSSFPGTRGNHSLNSNDLFGASAVPSYHSALSANSSVSSIDLTDSAMNLIGQLRRGSSDAAIPMVTLWTSDSSVSPSRGTGAVRAFSASHSPSPLSRQPIDANSVIQDRQPDLLSSPRDLDSPIETERGSPTYETRSNASLSQASANRDPSGEGGGNAEDAKQTTRSNSKKGRSSFKKRFNRFISK